jgi:hypothetical protein
MHRVEVDLTSMTGSPPGNQILTSGSWTIELTVTMRNVSVDPSRPPVIFDAILSSDPQH